jgi:OmpA family protein
MRKYRYGVVLLLLATLGFYGCATIPKGPSVMVLPGQGKTFDQFQTDDIVCRQFASQRIGASPQELASQSTATSAVVGTVIGGAAGALIGGAGGNAGSGAAIGAGTGLLFGTAMGAESGQYAGVTAQRMYDNAYMQCMYAKGNQIPGVVRQRPRRAYPPPPPDSYPPPPSSYPPPQPSYPPPR